MGKASRNKWQNRTEQAVQAAIANASEERRPQKPVAIRWCRGVGVGAIAIGGLGLMQTFFLASVIAVYLGACVLLLDLYFEKFEQTKGLKFLFAVMIICSCVAFTKSVVVRKAPLEIVYSATDGHLEAFISNLSEDDYESLDLKIKADFPKAFFTSYKQVTSVPGCSFVDPLPLIGNDGESIMGQLGPGPGPIRNPSTNFLRVRCDHLPAHSVLGIQAQLVESAGRDIVPKRNVAKVTLEGHFRGKFRIYEKSEVASGLVRSP